MQRASEKLYIKENYGGPRRLSRCRRSPGDDSRPGARPRRSPGAVLGGPRAGGILPFWSHRYFFVVLSLQNPSESVPNNQKNGNKKCAKNDTDRTRSTWVMLHF
eukprot:SAG11_NODE_1113_length_5809_cov_37.515672_1_plen_104_part_00